MPINVEVKTEVDEIKNGVYQATAMKGELLLSQKDRQITIPVGTPASQDKGKVETSVQGVPITLNVSGFSIDNAGVAKDLVAFLAGERETVSAEDHKVPGFLMFLAFLPLAIPAATLGGAIPGGIGGMLVFVSIMFAKQNNISVPARVGGLLAITVGGFIVTFGILFAIINNQVPR